MITNLTNTDIVIDMHIKEPIDTHEGHKKSLI